MENRLLNTQEAADYLKINPHKIRKLVHNKEIAFLNVSDGKNPSYRFDIKDLDKWVEKNKTR